VNFEFVDFIREGRPVPCPSLPCLLEFCYRNRKDLWIVIGPGWDWYLGWSHGGCGNVRLDQIQMKFVLELDIVKVNDLHPCILNIRRYSDSSLTLPWLCA